ncbi:PaaX family transcriptional regulator C-terminal domain-containing protein [Rhodococcus opacus]|nr:PaaX family transcriptional regulator C-terminal domain-containing protein [Rhodococcus opacus]
MLFAVLGELMWRSGQPAWTSSLLHVLNGLGFEEQAGRQAIARAAASKWIDGQRIGREVRWSLTPLGSRIFEQGAPRVRSMADPMVEWDGNWLVVLVSIPHSQRAVRKRVYSGLKWAGFGRPSSGVWLNPHRERGAEAAACIDEAGLTDQAMSFIGKAHDIGINEQAIVERGWELDRLEQHYATVSEAISSLEMTSVEDKLFADIRITSEWMRFPFLDPQLPEALLPDWIGRRVARQIMALRGQWRSEVDDYWAALNEITDSA